MKFLQQLFGLYLMGLSVLITCPSHCIGSTSAPLDVIDHDLRVVFDLKTQTLTANDQMTLSPTTKIWPQRFLLAQQAVIDKVFLDREPVAFTFQNGVLALDTATKRFQSLEISYHAKFNDIVPSQTVGIEDPSYGVNATISPLGVFLSSSANWTPLAPGYLGRFAIKVIGPKGLIAVTDGALVDLDYHDGQTVTSWHCRHPQQALTLAAGFYQMARNDLDDIQVMTFLSLENSGLAEQYLAASREYLTLYKTLFGPYPYDKFAVVENFFPTGYGLPGWTLLGSTVVRLPFILNSSLPHEIAHAWWGNAVGVDYYGGNWSEGLATYVADYLLKERSSPQEAHEYRLKLLRDYAALVEPGADFPLENFRSRKSKIEQAIGYGKTAMVFHMLRQTTGDDLFWKSLRRIAQHERGNRIGWEQIKQYFAETSGQNLDIFFKQWIEQTGAPLIAIADIQLSQSNNVWQIEGTIVQESKDYSLVLPIEVLTQINSKSFLISTVGHKTNFRLNIDGKPLQLLVDPENHIFRRLYPSETPQTINALRASNNQLVVISADSPHDLYDSSKDLLLGLKWDSAHTINESQLDKELMRTHDLLFLGWPKTSDYYQPAPDFVEINQNGFTINDISFKNKHDSLFLTLGKPDGLDGTVGIFYPMSIEAADMTARRISHYGRYSYLAFSASRNTVKGTWPIEQSPLIINFNKDNSP